MGSLPMLAVSAYGRMTEVCLVQTYTIGDGVPLAKAWQPSTVVGSLPFASSTEPTSESGPILLPKKVTISPGDAPVPAGAKLAALVAAVMVGPLLVVSKRATNPSPCRVLVLPTAPPPP